MWDIGGQRNIRSSWATYFVHTHALLMIIDSSDRARLGLVKEELDRLMESDALRSSALLVFANKMDVKGALSMAEICDKLELPSLLAGRSWHIQQCCALTGEGLFEGLDWAIHQIQGMK